MFLNRLVWGSALLCGLIVLDVRTARAVFCDPTSCAAQSNACAQYHCDATQGCIIAENLCPFCQESGGSGTLLFQGYAFGVNSHRVDFIDPATVNILLNFFDPQGNPNEFATLSMNIVDYSGPGQYPCSGTIEPGGSIQGYFYPCMMGTCTVTAPDQSDPAFCATFGIAFDGISVALESDHSCTSPVPIGGSYSYPPGTLPPTPTPTPGPTTMTYSSRDAFTAGGVGLKTIDFEGLSQQAFMDFGSGLMLQDVNFVGSDPGGPYLYIVKEGTEGYTWGSGDYLLWDSPGYLTVTLPPDVTTLGFDLMLDTDGTGIPPAGTKQFTITLGSGQQFHADSLPFPNRAFFGVASTAPIGTVRIEFTEKMRPPLPNLDNFSFGQAGAAPATYTPSPTNPPALFTPTSTPTIGFFTPTPTLTPTGGIFTPTPTSSPTSGIFTPTSSSTPTRSDLSPTATPSAITTSTATPVRPTVADTPTVTPTRAPALDTPTATATASVVVTISGACRRPGVTGLVPCGAGTPVTAFACSDPSCATLEEIGNTTTDAGGFYTLTLDARAGGQRPVDHCSGDPRHCRGHAARAHERGR